MEQKEKNNAVKEFLKRFLESAKCSPEMIAYLNEVDEAVFCAVSYTHLTLPTKA